MYFFELVEFKSIELQLVESFIVEQFIVVQLVVVQFKELVVVIEQFVQLVEFFKFFIVKQFELFELQQ